MRNIFKYTPFYSKGGKPELIEGDIFKIIIPLVAKIGPKITVEKTGVKTREKTRVKTREKLIDLMKNNPEITTGEMAEILGITAKGVEWHIKKLKIEGEIKRIGSAKGGYWKVIKAKENKGRK